MKPLSVPIDLPLTYHETRDGKDVRVVLDYWWELDHEYISQDRAYAIRRERDEYMRMQEAALKGSKP